MKSNILKSILSLAIVIALIVAAVGLISKLSDAAGKALDDIGVGGAENTTAATAATTTAAAAQTTLADVQTCSHTFVNGVCSKCGLVCAHPTVALNNGGNTYCTVCGKLVSLAAPVAEYKVISTYPYVRWLPVSDAVTYRIWVDGVAVSKMDAINSNGEIPDSYYSPLGGLTSGNHLVTITAKADTIESSPSNAVTVGVGYQCTGSITNGTLNQSVVAMPGESVTLNIAPASGYHCPASVIVTMGGTSLVAGTGYTYNSSTGLLTIGNVNGAIFVTGSCRTGAYAFVGVVKGGTETHTYSDGTITLTCVPDSGKVLPSAVTVYMPSDSDPMIELSSASYTWNSTTGVLTIPNASGKEVRAEITCAFAAPVLSRSEYIYSWTFVAGADSYLLYKNGVLWKTLTETETTVDGIESDGTYSFTVKAALSTDINGIYTSAASNAVEIDYTVRLMIADVSIAGTDLTWYGDSRATHYIVYKGTSADNLTVWQTVSANSCSLTELSYGTYYFKVVFCKCSDGNHADATTSEASDVVTYQKTTTLEAPVASWDHGTGNKTLTWSTVTGATGYYVYKDGYTGALANVDCSSFDVDAHVTAGTATFYVVAYSSDPLVNASEPSNILTGTYYSVTYSLTNLTWAKANCAQFIACSGTFFDAFLVPASGYTAPETITVTVGGTALVSGTDYLVTAQEDGSVLISINANKVNGNVVITASATQQLASYQLSGVWVLNSVLTVGEEVSQNVNFAFTYNSTQYNSTSMRYYLDDVDTGWYILYYVTYGDVYFSDETSRWACGDSFRTIDFGTTPQTVSEEFYNWFTANAVKQS